MRLLKVQSLFRWLSSFTTQNYEGNVGGTLIDYWRPAHPRLPRAFHGLSNWLVPNGRFLRLPYPRWIRSSRKDGHRVGGSWRAEGGLVEGSAGRLRGVGSEEDVEFRSVTQVNSLSGLVYSPVAFFWKKIFFPSSSGRGAFIYFLCVICNYLTDKGLLWFYSPRLAVVACCLLICTPGLTDLLPSSLPTTERSCCLMNSAAYPFGVCCSVSSCLAAYLCWKVDFKQTKKGNFPHNVLNGI